MGQVVAPSVLAGLQGQNLIDAATLEIVYFNVKSSP